VIKIPFLKPRPVRLSTLINELEVIEATSIFTNYGPANSKLEQALVRELFRTGECLTINNATVGLMLAIRDGMGETPASGQRALMPSFTFAATAHAAIWAGLTPLLCDIDGETWTAQAGGNNLHDDVSSGKLARVLSSPILRGVLATQPVTLDVLRQHGCSVQVSYVPGITVDLQRGRRWRLGGHCVRTYDPCTALPCVLGDCAACHRHFRSRTGSACGAMASRPN
jgi:hypothetical protein